MSFQRGTFSRLKIGGKQRENISGRKDSMNKGREDESLLWLCGVKDNPVWKEFTGTTGVQR